MIDPIRSEAVRIYVGWKRGPFPDGDPDRVRRMLVPDPAALVAYVKSVVDEMAAAYPLSMASDFEPTDARRRVETGMAARHPELDAEAVSALAWMWGYSAWK